MSQAVQYTIRDAQGHEYGPADVPLLRQWILEKRILGHFQIAPVGTGQWQPVASHPQLADLFAAPAPDAAPVPASPYAPAAPAPEAATSPMPSPSVPYATPAGYQPVPQTNSLAIASLVCSLINFCGIGSILGIIFGLMARRQIRENPQTQSGDGLALAGIIVGAVTLALNCLITGCIIFSIAMDNH